MTEAKPNIPPFTVKFSSLKLKRESVGGADMNTQRADFINDETQTLMVSISEWMSSILNKHIDSDLTTVLDDGIDLCSLFEKCFPNQPLGNWHKDVSKFPLFKRDNIWAFVDGCKKVGIPTGSIIDYTYFNSKDNYRFVGCMLMFIKTVFEKNGLAVTTESKKNQETIGRISDIFLNDESDIIDANLLSDITDIDIELGVNLHSSSDAVIPPEIASFSPIGSPPTVLPSSSNPEQYPHPESYTHEDEEEDVIPITDVDIEINEGLQLSMENGSIPFNTIPPEEIKKDEIPENSSVPVVSTEQEINKEVPIQQEAPIQQKVSIQQEVPVPPVVSSFPTNQLESTKQVPEPENEEEREETVELPQEKSWGLFSCCRPKRIVPHD